MSAGLFAHRREVEYREWRRSDASGRNDRDADDVLSLSGRVPYRVTPDTTNGQRMVNDAATLESYSKGTLMLGCGR
jgi:hypothetical protein